MSSMGQQWQSRMGKLKGATLLVTHGVWLIKICFLLLLRLRLSFARLKTQPGKEISVQATQTSFKFCFDTHAEGWEWEGLLEKWESGSNSFSSRTTPLATAVVAVATLFCSVLVLPHASPTLPLSLSLSLSLIKTLDTETRKVALMKMKKENVSCGTCCK